MERPAHFPDRNDPLLQAARHNDAQAEESGVSSVLADLGIELSTLLHIAHQRATAAVLVRHGQLDILRRVSAGERLNPGLTQAQEEEVKELIPLYMDAIAIGWRACSLSGEQGG